MAGQLSVEIRIPIVDDDVAESSNEDFRIGLRLDNPPEGLMIGKNESSVVIADDDGEYNDIQVK